MEIYLLNKKDVKEYSKVAKKIINKVPYYSLKAKKWETKNFESSRISKNLKDKSKIHVVAKEKRKIIGFLSGYFYAGTFWVDWIGVLREFRKKKVSLELFRYTEKVAKKREAHKIWFDSRTNNKEAISLFKKLGYKKIVLLKNHWYGHDFYMWQKLI